MTNLSFPESHKITKPLHLCAKLGGKHQTSPLRLQPRPPVSFADPHQPEIVYGLEQFCYSYCNCSFENPHQPELIYGLEYFCY